MHSELDSVPAAALAWCIAHAPGARRVRDVQRLRGGLVAATHRIVVELADGADRSLVLRRFPAKADEWLSVEREVRTLEALAAHDSLPVPRVVAYDVAGAACGAPALLLTCLEGTIDIGTADVSRKVSELGRALGKFHDLLPSCIEGAKHYALDFTRRELAVPAGIVAPDWLRVWRMLESLRWESAQLIHRDYHIGNVLFASGELTGIVDWSIAECGPWQFDVGYCRMDLSMVFGLAEADLFLEVYERERGYAVSDLSLWDLAGSVSAFPDPAKWLSGWLDAGRSDLNPELLQQRLTAFVERALARATPVR